MAKKTDVIIINRAFTMYCAGMLQKDIADTIGVTPKTISKWAEDDEWEKKRSAGTVTRTELVNKTLQKIAAILDGDGSDSQVADQLAKLATLIEKLDKKNSPVIAIEVFEKFVAYLQEIMPNDKSITLDDLKRINLLQNKFINSLIAAK